MNINIWIDCGNAAFEGNPALETARILRKLADKMDSENTMLDLNGTSLLDINGNRTGFIDVNTE